MQEFVYYDPVGLDFPVDEAILVTSNIDELKSSNFLISNTPEINCEIVADEISFYIKNSKDPISKKISNINKLYEISAKKYDNSKDIDYDVVIQNKVLVIANSDDSKEFAQNISDEEFDLFYIDETKLVEINGNIGDFKITLKADDTEISIQVDQIVWCNAKREKEYVRAGIYDPKDSSSLEVIEQLRANVSSYSYKRFISYDKSICQYHDRREEICSSCVSACPTNAITKIDKIKELKFSHIDCIGCASCVSVCPSGAIDATQIDKASLYELSYFYENTHPLILPSKISLEDLQVELKEDVLPFRVRSEKIFDEANLLTLAQMSGSQIVVYAKELKQTTIDAINIINGIYQKRYSKDAILVANDESELQKVLEGVSFIENSRYNYNQSTQRKREIFASRLQHIVGEDDLGFVTTGESIHYGKVEVNESTCTLCLSCVGACNVDAITANANDNTLRINPSICTACGYCEVSCPEKDCLTIKSDVIELNPTWFTEQILAKDELFACIECGKEFATKKAVEKIANMMGPIFASNPTKERTLYCCEDCKAKLMIKQGLLSEY